MFVQKGELLGHWDLEWSYDWMALLDAPSLQEGHKIKVMSKVRLLHIV